MSVASTLRRWITRARNRWLVRYPDADPLRCPGSGVEVRALRFARGERVPCRYCGQDTEVVFHLDGSPGTPVLADHPIPEDEHR